MLKKLILILLFFFLAPTAQAAGPMLLGGQITSVYYCCNGIKLKVGEPRGGDFLFTFGSILHAYYNIFRAGPWVLGTARPGGTCLNPIAWPPCTRTIRVDGTIIRVGTSKL